MFSDTNIHNHNSKEGELYTMKSEKNEMQEKIDQLLYYLWPFTKLLMDVSTNMPALQS